MPPSPNVIGPIVECSGCPWLHQGPWPTTPFTNTLTLTVLMDRITTLGFLLALLAIWAPGGLIDCGRQAAAPITPYASLAR